MATPTYTPIETYTLGTAASSITFGSGNTLPQTYTDLVIVIQGIQESSYSARNMAIRFNGDTGSNYSSVQILNTTSGADANLGSAYGPLINSSTNTTSGAFANAIINVQNYAKNNMYKTIINQGGTAAAFTSGGSNVGVYNGINTALWRNTAPITEITLYATNTSGAGSGANWVAGSTFTLYGIANAAIGAPKATGGIITYDNTYYYHTFGASGTFTPQQSLTADILVVAGGGGASAYAGGGGGAGGVVYNANTSLASSTNYTCTVGAGGASANGTTPSNGVSSNVTGGSLSLTAAVGGGAGGLGGGQTGSPGQNGGSGGGGGSGSGSESYGNGTSGQGNRGGTSAGATGNYGSAGGGGAGAIGSDGGSTAGAGGDGTTTYSSWGLTTGTGQNVSGVVYYAGGGGGGISFNQPGGTGGKGGGGTGGSWNSAGNLVVSGTSGLVNTGGGAGAGNTGTSGSGTPALTNGGSGVIIIRYLKA